MWKRNLTGLQKSKIQGIFQNYITKKLVKAVAGHVEMQRDIHLEHVFTHCSPYIHKDYDGDPALALGTASALVKTGISGIANILPFTCMPATIICSVSPAFRKDHNNIPWVNIDYDGQENAALETRLQAFMYQAREFNRVSGTDEPRVW